MNKTGKITADTTTKEHVTAWVTKWALSDGIIVVEGVVNKSWGGMLSFVAHGVSNYAHENDWHRTYEAAMARAEEMRQNKIASLKKQIAKLEAMTF